MARFYGAIVGLFLLMGSASAQDYSSALTGVKPSDVKFKTIDTSSVLRTPSMTTSSLGQTFSLTNFFRKFTGPSTKPVRGVSAIPKAQYRSPVTPRLPTSSQVR